MLKIKLHTSKKRNLKVLCLGAHSDDIEIGCGGTILRLLSEYDHVDAYWIVFAAASARHDEALESANRFLSKATTKEILIKDFQDGYFPYIGGNIKDIFEQVKKDFSPELILTHYRHDLHQDHRLVSELTWNTFRDHLILEYEIIKYDGDLGVPNLFVHLSEAACQKKIDSILDAFKSQKNKDWFTADAFLSLLRIRGIESKAPEKYAEGFYCRKIVI